MLPLLELNNQNKLVISAEAISLPRFAKIWEADKSKDKTTARKHLSYIYWAGHYKSPYRTVPQSEQLLTIATEALDDPQYHPPKEVSDALTFFKKIQERMSLSLALLKDAESAVNKIREYFREVDLTSRDEYGKVLYSAKDLVSNIKAVGELHQSLKSLRQEVEKEAEASQQIRGDDKLGLFEDPDNAI